MNVEIKVRHCTDDPWLDRKMFGAFWWTVYARGYGAKAGSARSFASAQKKAQVAAERLVKVPESTTYTYETK